tara:strand:- start:259855 stop:261060 length:1206 start_codon:yes stop_codon:yes gene_type:complete
VSNQYATENVTLAEPDLKPFSQGGYQETPEERIDGECANAKAWGRLGWIPLAMFEFMSGLPVFSQPLARLSASIRMVINACVLAGASIVAAGLALNGMAWTAILPALIVVRSARWAQLVTIHIAAHAKPHERALRAAGHILSALLLIEPFELGKSGYAPDHKNDHHSPFKLSTPSDPTYWFLTFYMGVRPGAPVRENARRLALNFFNPWTHARIFFGRVAANFTGATFTKAAAGIQLCTWGALAAVGLGEVLLIAWVLPITLGFQLAQMLRLPLEHRWRPAREDAFEPRALRRFLTPVNHLVEPCLADNAGLAARSTYYVRQALNFALRAIAFPRDSAWGHAAHHERAFDIGDGERAAYEFRCRLIAKGDPLNPVNWGYCAALLGFLRSAKAAAPARKEGL